MRTQPNLPQNSHDKPVLLAHMMGFFPELISLHIWAKPKCLTSFTKSLRRYLQGRSPLSLMRQLAALMQAVAAALTTWPSWTPVYFPPLLKGFRESLSSLLPYLLITSPSKLPSAQLLPMESAETLSPTSLTHQWLDWGVSQGLFSGSAHLLRAFNAGGHALSRSLSVARGKGKRNERVLTAHCPLICWNQELVLSI